MIFLGSIIKGFLLCKTFKWRKWVINNMKGENNEQEINKGLKLIVKSSFVVFITLFLSKIISYAYRIVLARYYGPEIYGLFSLAIMVLGWFVAFSSFGLTDGLLRYIPWYRGKKKYKEIKHILRISTIVLVSSGIFSAIILFLFSEYIAINFFHSPELIIFLKIFSLLIPISLFANMSLSILQAFEKISWHSFILNVFQNLVKVVSIILLIFLGFKTNAIIFSYFLGIFSMLLISFFVCKYKIPEIFGKYELENSAKNKISKEFFSYSWPLMLAGIISNVLLWIDSFALGYFKGPLEVGLYNAAIPLVVLIRFAPELFLKLFFPFVTKEFARKNFQVVKQISKQVGKWIFILNLPLFFIILLFPGEIINLLFGAEYVFAKTALQVLAIGSFAISFVFISYNLLSMAGKSKLILIDTLLASIFNIVLNIFLIPKPFIFGWDNSLGILGAALATTIVNIFLTIAVFFQAKYYTSIIPVRKKMLKIFFIFLFPLFLLIFIKKYIIFNLISLAFLWIFFFLLYYLLIFITGCLDKNDFMILRSLRAKFRPIN